MKAIKTGVQQARAGYREQVDQVVDVASAIRRGDARPTLAAKHVGLGLVAEAESLAKAAVTVALGAPLSLFVAGSAALRSAAYRVRDLTTEVPDHRRDDADYFAWGAKLSLRAPYRNAWQLLVEGAEVSREHYRGAELAMRGGAREANLTGYPRGWTAVDTEQPEHFRRYHTPVTRFHDNGVLKERYASEGFRSKE